MGKKLLILLFSVLLCLLAGGIGAIFTSESIPTWYATLNKPFFNPPNWIFGPVWSTLYLLMGVSFTLFLTTKSKIKKSYGIKLFLAQLILNTLWSIIFFGMRSPLLAVVEILFMWLFIFLTIKEFKKVSPWSSYLLIPYLAWVSFASLLNASVVFLN